MQSLIHGNFEGAAPGARLRAGRGFVGDRHAIGPLIGGFITTFINWRVAFALEAVIIAIVLLGIKLVHDVTFTGRSTRSTWIGSLLSVVGMGGDRRRAS